MRLQTSQLINDRNPIVTNQCQAVPLPLTLEDQTFLTKMFQYVEDSQNPQLRKKFQLRGAVGLAANQMGVSKRLIVVIAEGHRYAMANPKLMSNSTRKAYLLSGEGCLSVDECYKGYVVRSYQVTVTGYDLLQNREITVTLKGYPAIVMQHELDHLEGRLFYQRINQENPFEKVKDAMEI